MGYGRDEELDGDEVVAVGEASEITARVAVEVEVEASGGPVGSLHIGAPAPAVVDKAQDGEGTDSRGAVSQIVETPVPDVGQVAVPQTQTLQSQALETTSSSVRLSLLCLLPHLSLAI